MYLIPYTFFYIYSYNQFIPYTDLVEMNNYDATNNPTYNYQLYSQFRTFDISQEQTEEISQEQTEEFEQSNFPTFKPSKYIFPTKPINNISCICEYNNNQNKNLIIISCVSSTLCLILFVTLIWYRFIFKKKY